MKSPRRIRYQAKQTTIKAARAAASEKKAIELAWEQAKAKAVLERQSKRNK